MICMSKRQITWYSCHCGGGNAVAGPIANNPPWTPAIDSVYNCYVAHDTEYVNNNCAAYNPINHPQGRPPACDDADKVFCKCLKMANGNWNRLLFVWPIRGDDCLDQKPRIQYLNKELANV